MKDRKIHPIEEFIFRSMLDKKISPEQQSKFVQAAVKAITQLKAKISFPDVYCEFKNNAHGETGLIEKDFHQNFLPNLESWYEHDDRKGTMLMWAAAEGYSQYVRLLVKNNAEINFIGHDEGYTAVHAAVFLNRPLCVQELVAAKADVNIRNINGYTALMLAAGNGHTESLQVLIECKADLTAQNKDQRTALMLATSNNQITCLQKLVEAKANLNCKSSFDETALILAAKAGHAECLQVLIESKADLTAQDKNQDTALMSAAFNNKITCLQKLVDAKAFLNHKDKDSETALMWAAHKGNIECLKVLIEAKADVNVRNSNDLTALILAAGKGNAECLQILIDSKTNLNENNKDQFTAVINSIWNNKSTCLKKLIEAKIDINIRSIFGSIPPLILAAGKGYVECLQVLIESKADLTIQDKFQRTALIFSTLKNQTVCLQKLVDAKADVNVRDIDGITSLMIAARKGNVESLQILIESKADLTAQDIDQNTALMLATLNNHIVCLKNIVNAKANVNAKNIYGISPLLLATGRGHTECLQVLIDSKADLTVQDKDQRTALMCAAFNNKITCLQKLVSAKSDVYVRDIHGATALIFAAENGHTECLQILIENKSDLAAQDEHHHTALMFATKNNQITCLQKLVEAKADVNHKDAQSQSALMWAARNGNPECLQVLIGSKADINSKDKNQNTALMIASYFNQSNCVRALIEVNADTSGALDIAKGKNNLDIISLLLKSQTITPYYDLPLIQTIIKIGTESKLTESEIYSTLDKHLSGVSKLTEAQWNSVLIYAVTNNNLAAVKWFFVNSQKYKKDITKLNNRNQNGMTALICSVAYTDSTRDSKVESVLKKRNIINVLIQHTWMQSKEIADKFADFSEALETIFLFNNLYALNSMANTVILYAGPAIEIILKYLFQKAVNKNNLEILNLLIGIIEKDNKINLKDRLIKSCGSWMNEVIAQADLKMVEVLIAHDFITDACLDYKSGTKYSPLYWLFHRFKEKKITEDQILQLLQLILVKCNSMQGMKDDALIMSTALGAVGIAKLLIEHKATINTRKSFIDSSLHSPALDLAVERGNIDIMKLLLSKGAVHTPQTVKKLDQSEKSLISEIKIITPESEHLLENFYRTKKYLQAMQAIIEKNPQVAFLCRDLTFEDQKDLYNLFKKHHLNEKGWIDKLFSHYLEKVKQNKDEKPIAIIVPPSAPLEIKANAPKIPELKNEISLNGLSPDYVQHAIQQEIAENEFKEINHIQIEGQPNAISKGEQEPGQNPDLQQLVANEVKSQPPLRLAPSVAFFGNANVLGDGQYTEQLLHLIKQNPEYWAKYPNGNMMKKMLEAFFENVSDMLNKSQPAQQRHSR